MRTLVNYDMADGSTVRYLVYENADPTGGYFVALMAGDSGVPINHWRHHNLEDALSRAGIVEYVEGVQQYYDGRPDARREGS